MQPAQDPWTECAQRLEAAAYAKKPADMQALIDWPAIVDHACQGITISPQQRQGFLAAAQSGVYFETQIRDAVTRGGSYHCVRLKEDPVGRRALFRLISDTGVNYHEILLSAAADAPPRVVDVQVHATGQMLSESMHWVFVPLAAGAEKGLLAPLSQQDDAFLRSLPTLQKVQSAWEPINMRSRSTTAGNCRSRLPIAFMCCRCACRPRPASALGKRPKR